MAGKPTTSQAKSREGSRPLPEDPSEWDKALLPYKGLVRTPLIAVSKTLKYLPPHEPLDAAEMAGGEQAFAALLYQEGAQMNAWTMVALWGLGIGSFRLIKYLDTREQRAAEKAKVITGEELSRKVGVERDAQSVQHTTPAPAPSNPAPRPTNGVTVGGSAAQEPEPQKKPITAEQAVTIIQFPGDKN